VDVAAVELLSYLKLQTSSRPIGRSSIGYVCLKTIYKVTYMILNTPPFMIIFVVVDSVISILQVFVGLIHNLFTSTDLQLKSPKCFRK